MKKICFIPLAVILLVLCRINVNALDQTCTLNEQMRLRNLTNATQISYEFFENKEEATNGFKVKISGFSADFYVYNVTNGIYFPYYGENVSVSDAFAPGQTYSLPFYASDTGVCKGFLIQTKYVKLPNYNYYYKDPLCKEHETYELCKKFTSLVPSNYAEFENLMQKYIKSLEKSNGKTPTNEEEKTTSSKSILEIVGDFFAHNYLIFLIAIIISGTAGIIFIELKKRRSILWRN